MASTSQPQYESCVAEFGPALDRLASAYEADFELRRDLLQEIHIALWKSLAVFDNRCSLRTWTFRVAHNTAASYVGRTISRNSALVSIESLQALPIDNALDTNIDLGRLRALIHQLQPSDRQIILLYLEGLDSKAIAEVTGRTVSSVTTKIHRTKEILARQFHQGDSAYARSR